MYIEKPWFEIINLIKYVLNLCRHKLCSMLSPMKNHNRVCILTIEVRWNFLVLRNPRTATSSDLSTRKVSNCVALFSISVALIMQPCNRSWSHFDFFLKLSTTFGIEISHMIKTKVEWDPATETSTTVL